MCTRSVFRRAGSGAAGYRGQILGSSANLSERRRADQPPRHRNHHQGGEIMRKYVAEFIGTFALVFFGCATVIFMRSEVGLLGVAFAFGLSVVAMAYSIGHISGAH